MYCAYDIYIIYSIYNKRVCTFYSLFWATVMRETVELHFGITVFSPRFCTTVVNVLVMSCAKLKLCILHAHCMHIYYIMYIKRRQSYILSLLILQTNKHDAKQ